jgi:hypothetical protein
LRAFFYGTLIDADVRATVLGPAARHRPVEPAVLPGYRRVTMRGCTYPVIVPDARGEVPGVLMRGLSRADFARLLDYETDEYRAIDADVLTRPGRRIVAKVFIASARALPSPAPWSAADWQRRFKRAFLRRLRAGAGV